MRRALKVIIGKLDYERFPEIGLESLPSVPGNPGNGIFGKIWYLVDSLTTLKLQSFRWPIEEISKG